MICYSELFGKASVKQAESAFNPNQITAAKKIPLTYDFEMPYSEASQYFGQLGIIDAPTFYSDLEQYAGQAFTISYITKAETLIGVKDYIAKQLGDGKVDREALSAVIQAFAVSNGDDPLTPFHIETIIRTNLQTAFSKGRYLSQKESSNPIWFYSAIVDGRETPLCNSLDGKAFRKNDDFWSNYYPPNHFNCRSGVSAIDEETARDFGIKVEPDGNKFLDKERKAFPKVEIEAGKGFDNSPDKGLSKWINQGCKDNNIENITDTVPQFKTLRELNIWANKQGIADYVKFAGIPVESAREWITSFYYTFKKFPELRKKMQFTGTTQERNKIWIKNIKDEVWLNIKSKHNLSEADRSLFENTITRIVKEKKIGKIVHGESASSVAGSKYGINGISINKIFAKDYDTMMNRLNRSVLIKNSPEGCNSIKAVVDHEFGHQIDYLINFAENKKFIEYHSQFNFTEIRKGLSIYARTDKYEFIAEAWSEYQNNPNPRPIAKHIGEAMIEEYEKWKKKE